VATKTDYYQITLPYACFGVTVGNNTVVDAPPIGRWMIGKAWAFVAEWVAKKHGAVRKGGQ